MSSHDRVISAARLIGLATILSRITGMIRDQALVIAFGATWISDAFWYAFQFPNLFRRLFAEGAMSAVFVPTFSKTLETEGRDAAWALLARTIALLVVTLVLIVIAVELIIAVVWFGLSQYGDPQHEAARRLLLSLTALMFPFMLTISVLALLSSILNCVGSFVPAALMPMVTNVVMLLGILYAGPAIARTCGPATTPSTSPASTDLYSSSIPAATTSAALVKSYEIYGVAASVLVAGVTQLLLIYPVVRRNGIRLGWRFEPRDPVVRRMLALVGPVIAGQGILLIGVFLDAQVCALFTHVKDSPENGSILGFTFAYPLQEGALSRLNLAQRLYQFPLGVLAISIATAALPTLSRLAARSEWGDWAGQLRSAIRMGVFVGLPAGAMMLAIPEPIMRLLFEYKQFTPDNTAWAAWVLACYGIGMWSFCVQHVVLRGFYSIGDVATPLRISCVFLPVNLLLSFVLIWVPSIREAAFGLSTSITSSLNVLVGVLILQHKKRAPLIDGHVAFAILKMLLASAAAAAAVWPIRAIQLPSSTRLTDAILHRAAAALVPLAVGCAAYLAVAALLRLPEPRMLFARRRGIAPAPGNIDPATGP